MIFSVSKMAIFYGGIQPGGGKLAWAVPPKAPILMR